MDTRGKYWLLGGRYVGPYLGVAFSDAPLTEIIRERGVSHRFAMDPDFIVADGQYAGLWTARTADRLWASTWPENAAVRGSR